MTKDLSKLLDDKGIFAAVAVDQRGALRKLLGEKGTDENLAIYKELVAETLSPHGSAILLDPEYGFTAAGKKSSQAGLIMAYEQTGYEKLGPGRFPRLVQDCSVKNLVERGADAIKLLIYVDVDESDDINKVKEAFVERVGSECVAENVPLLLEILVYDDQIGDEKGKDFAKVRPRKVIEAMKKYSDSRFNVDVLKVEVPVNMNYVEGYGDDFVYTKEEAAAFFKEQTAATHLPFVYLSGGVSPELFNETLIFANESGSKFNGILCGRATWKAGTEVFLNEGQDAAKSWLLSKGLENLNNLNEVNLKNATPLV
ncbi:MULTISPECIES: tagatose 1,6-diphosphate aldolase [Macrococcoides]|uniref:Tagatose 1,6-diphosphate aldolase n=2 Tax=Macrococcoides TaxID=3076173 RepID=A0A509GMN5_9STAP|nr:MULTISPECIES: tagatose 1,6-diphosphate aldolase [Macrococcus]QAX90285.1 Tagatose 1,6-diphosphate aldolase [Macrococcus canis]QIH77136.1 tagatose 1,6-diphosphate aldolase [Macrococcus canis]QNR06756.1 tagatose 1,6-diphosphate aldolase [Macrococcus canis]RAI81081.1 tagatose 1,6-diphosphate aldolase [Macrococcus goetzii]